MNIWKTTLLLVLLFTGITVHAQKVKISLNSDGNLTIWKVKAQAEIEHPSDMMTTRYDTRDWVKATVPGTVFGSYVLEGLEPDPKKLMVKRQMRLRILLIMRIKSIKQNMTVTSGIVQSLIRRRWKTEKEYG